MPKEILTIDKFDGMNPSMLTEGLVCIENARIDITPALVQEKADRAITGTIYVDSKTFTVNGVSHTVSVTTAGAIYVDGTLYDYMSGSTWEITVFGSVAMIIATDQSVPAKIVTFGTNLDGAFRDVNVTTVSNDSIGTFGSLSDVKKFFVLNANLAVVLFGGALKPAFFVLDTFAAPAVDPVTYTAGTAIDCEEFGFEIIDMAPHYNGLVVDFLVFAYLNDSNQLCFGKYDIDDCFTDSDTTDATKFLVGEVTDTINTYFITITSAHTHVGYSFGAMAVTLNKVFFQMIKEDSEVLNGWGTDTVYISENEDFLFSFALTEFDSVNRALADTDDWSSAGVAHYLQKSCLPLYGFNYAVSGSGTIQTLYIKALFMNTGIWILNYQYDIAGVSVVLYTKIGTDSSPYVMTKRALVLYWNGVQPYGFTEGTATPGTIPYEITMPQWTSGFSKTDITTRKFLDSSSYHAEGSYRGSYDVALSDVTYTGYIGKRTIASLIAKVDTPYVPVVITTTSDGSSWSVSPRVETETYNVYHNIFSWDFSTSTPRVATEIDLPVSQVSVIPTLTDNYFYVFKDREIKRVTSTYHDHGTYTKEIYVWYSTDLDTIPTGVDFIELLDIASPESSLTSGVYRYAYSFIYDGYQESPLSTDRYDVSVTATHSVQIDISVTPSLLRVLPIRITGINIYSAKVSGTGGDEEELYRLVKALPFSYSSFSFDTPNYVARVIDSGNRLGSFDAVAGYSETLKSVSVNRRVQCSCAGYMFVGGCDINAVKEKVNIDNIIVRSLPLQPSIYDYSRNFAVLPFTATAMTEYNNRLYVFGADEYAIVNPDTMAVELKSKTLGCSEPEQMVSTEYGLFVYYNGNVYNIEGLNVIPIGDSVKTSAFTTAGVTYVPSIGALFNCKLSYVDRRDALILLGYDATTNSILSFMFSFATKRWIVYTITTTERYPLSVYDYEDTIALVMVTDEDVASAIRLFDGTTFRTVRVVANVSFGDPVPKKIVYGVLVNKDGAPGMTLLKDGVSTSFPDNLYTATYSVSYAGNIDWISFVYRVFVNKEHFFVPSIRVENPVETDVYDLGEFFAIDGGTSETLSYYVGGFGFVSDLTITPPAGFEISLDETTWYDSGDSPLTISHIVANDYMTKVYVRFVAGTTIASNIVHSSGTVSKNLAVTGIVFPSEALVMLINDAAMAAYAPDEAITTLPNQHINADLAGFDSLGVSGGDSVTLSSETLNAKKLLRLATRWIGSPSFCYTRAYLSRQPNGVTGYPYSPGISGVTRSILIYPDKTLFTGGDSQHKASEAHAIGYMNLSAGEYTGLLTGTSSKQWLFATGQAYTFQELGLAPEINGEWCHFIIVETGGVNRSVQVYVNGALLFDASLPNRTLYPNIITLEHLNKRNNSIGASFNGYYAHGATWLKALSITEINDVIKTINYEYGLTNPLIEA